MNPVDPMDRPLAPAHQRRRRFIWYRVTLHVVFAASAAYGLREGDLTTRFTLTGQTDMDELVAVYNEMVGLLA